MFCCSASVLLHGCTAHIKSPTPWAGQLFLQCGSNCIRLSLNFALILPLSTFAFALVAKCQLYNNVDAGKTHNEASAASTDGWMTCDFTSFSTVFQSFQDDRRLIMKGFVQWSSGTMGV